MAALLIDGGPLTLTEIEDVALRGRPVQVRASAIAGVARSREAVDEILTRGHVVYGVNTGFGHLANVRVADADLFELQRNLVRSHCVGVGEPFDVPTTRALTLLRANVLAAGHSGVRLEVLERLLAMLETGIHPRVPCQGSVGASGDLAPLAHLALALLGDGEVHAPGGGFRPAADALAEAGLEPLRLAPKEGLSLINGTQAMTALGCLVTARARRLARVADIAGAMTVEAKLGSYRPFDERLHLLRPHPGQLKTAANLRRLLRGGDLNHSHVDCDKVQDPYSLRCMPQVHGAARQAIEHVAEVLSIESGSVTDNPTVFAEAGDVISGGNFHGQPVSTALDYLAIGISEFGAMSERRTEQLVNPRLSPDLPAFLVQESGLNSGFMMVQVTAAALASENKGLCHPASVDSIPTSAGQEDHVSMGPIAARKANAVLVNVERILAIELLSATQSLDFRAPLIPADGPRAAQELIRRHVPHFDGDRVFAGEMELVADLVRSGDLLAAVEAVVGELD